MYLRIGLAALALLGVLGFAFAGPADGRKPNISTVTIEDVVFAKSGPVVNGTSTNERRKCLRNRKVIIRAIGNGPSRGNPGNATIGATRTDANGDWELTINYFRSNEIKAILKGRRSEKGRGFCSRATDTYQVPVFR